MRRGIAAFSYRLQKLPLRESVVSTMLDCYGIRQVKYMKL